KGWAILLRQKQKKLIMLPSETMIWQPEFTDKTLSRKPGAVQTIVNPGFMLALKEQEEALIVLEALEADAIKVQGEKKLVSLFSDDLNNPLYKVIERINKQMLIGKTPKTLADLFFIEQKRIERNNNG
ncbi:hypothetical protein AB9L90_23595, partial [Escherichia coli]